MKLDIETHPNYTALTTEEAMSLWMEARYNLKAGMELEYGYIDGNTVAPDPNQTLQKIKEIVLRKYKYEIAIQKGGATKKVVNRELVDNRTGMVIKFEDIIESDGFKEHHIAPYAYEDGSVAIEIVMSPEMLLVKRIAEKIFKIDSAVEEADPKLIQSPVCNCGLHQTLVFDHLERMFPEIVCVNIIQIVRAYMAGLIFISASGSLKNPTRGMNYRGFMRSVWKVGSLSGFGKYCLATPRYGQGGIWGMEFRYPDGTNSRALAGAIAVLNGAIILKAINLSRYGVLKVSDGAYRKSKELVLNFTRNAMEPEDWEIIKSIASEIIKFLSDQITEIDPRAYSILEKISENPLFSLAKTDEEITRHVYSEFDRILNEEIPQDEQSVQLLKHIELDTVMGLDIKEAKKKLARKVKVKYVEISELLKKNNIVWDEGLQKFAKVQTELF